MKKNILALLLSYVCFSAPVSANVIFENPLEDLEGVTGIFSDPFIPAEIGDTFSIRTTSIINSVKWWGGFAEDSPIYPDDFIISIYELDGGVPKKTPLFLHNVGSVEVENSRFLEWGGGISEYKFSSPIAAITLDPGDYLLSIVNNVEEPWWAWHTSSASGSGWRRDGISSDWTEMEYKLAFILKGEEVPEPRVLTLLIIGLSLLFIRRRKHLPKPSKPQLCGMI